MSQSTELKNLLKTKIESLPSVQKVYGFEKINPEGFPAIMLTPQDLQGEFSSNVENSRTYAFKCLILFPISQDFPVTTDLPRMEYAEQVIATVIDEIVNDMDTDFELTGSTALYMNAADCLWSYTKYEGGEARSAEITLSIYTERTVV